MKKSLLGASALVGAASFAAAPAMAEAPEISFSGALAYEMVIHDGDIDAGGTGINITGNEQQSELVWEATGTADNGLEYGANAQWRWMRNSAGADRSGGDFDESWIDFSGSFGRVYLGAEDGVSDLVAGTAGHTVQVGAWGTDGNNALRHANLAGAANATLHYYQSHAAMTADANKIGYVTPSFSGFQAGVSFVPDNTAQQQGPVNNGAAQNVFEFAAGYSGTFGDVSVNLDGSYGIGEDNSAIAGATEIGSEDIAAYMIGGMVGFAGFNIAAAYLDNDDSGCPDNVPNCDAGDGWNIGAGYSFGSVGVSAMYQEAENDPDGNGFNDESEIFHAGVNFTIAEGLSAHANYYAMSFDNEAGSAAATNNDADVLILGSRITF
eukprot:g14136.t1